MEFSDAINGQTFAVAVDLTRQVQSSERAPLVDHAALAVAQTFCTCVTDGEHAAEHQFSAIHRELILEVVKHVRGDDGDAELNAPSNLPDNRDAS